MFISKEKYKSLKKTCRLLEKENHDLTINLAYAQSDIRLIRAGAMDTMKALLLLNKKTQNLTEIVKLLPTNKERKKVIAVTKDGTKITIGDVLDSEDLIPQEGEEYQSAII